MGSFRVRVFVLMHVCGCVYLSVCGCGWLVSVFGFRVGERVCVRVCVLVLMCLRMLLHVSVCVASPPVCVIECV